MTEALWIVVVVNLLGFLGLLIKAIYEYKGKKIAGRKNTNPGAKNSTVWGVRPGYAQSCNEHGNKLVELDTRIKGIEEDVREMKLDIRTMKNRT